MQLETKTSVKNWLIVLGIIGVILAVCIAQIHTGRFSSVTINQYVH